MKRLLLSLLFAYVFAPAQAFAWIWIENIPRTVTVESVPTLDATAYASGDCMHASAVALSGAAKSGTSAGRITSVVIQDLAAQAGNIDVVFFDSDPGAVCSAVNAAFDPSDDDVDDIVAVVSVNQHYSWNDNSTSEATNISIPFVIDSNGTTLYYALVARAAIDLGDDGDGTSTDIKVRVTIDQD